MPTLEETGFLSYYEAVSGTSTLTKKVWHVNSNKRHAFYVYSDFDGLKEADEKIVTQGAEPTLITIDNFSDLNPTLFRTKVVKDNGGQNIELDLDGRIVTLLMDQSGSMTWNDNGGLRHTIAQRIVNRIKSTYPGNVKFNILEFGGTPIKVTLFAVTEVDEILGDDINEISTAFFQDHESNFAGSRVVRRTGAFPEHPLDGDIVSEGFLNKSFSGSLDEGTQYFYKVFTFDKNFHFSTGVEISATPREQNIPRGVASLTSEVLSGTGVANDDNVVGAWHFDEGREKTVYDFSGSSANLTIDGQEVWIESEGVPSGGSGLRFNGSNNSASSANTSKAAISDKLTLMGWIYPFRLSTDYAIIGRQGTSNANYLLYVSSKKLGFFNGNSSVITDTDVLTEATWNHVAITANYSSGVVDFYVNGSFVDSQTLSSLSTNTGSMFIDVGLDRLGSVGASRFFGRIAEFSIHNTIRDIVYIQVQSVIEANVDNGDRLVVLKYEIPEDFNFSGGKVKLLRNNFSVPSWEGDGDIIFEGTPSVGTATVVDTDDLVLGATINYSIFAQNAIGNFSRREDSPETSVVIPSLKDQDTLEPLSSPLTPPVAPVVRVGNKKIFLKWTNFPNDSRISRVKIFYSDSEFPVANDRGEFSGELVFEGTASNTTFVHRDIPNAQSAFYSIVNNDRLGRVSIPTNASGIPEAGVDETGIPLLEVKNISYEIVDNNSLQILWDNPVDFKSDIQGFFGERILIYAAITDEFGAPLSDDTTVTMKLEPVISRSFQANNVFGTAGVVTNFDDEDTFEFAVSQLSSGIVKGSLRMVVESGVLSAISQATFKIQVHSFIPDPTSAILDNGLHEKNLFEFLSESISVTLVNPWEVEVANRDNRKVTRKCPLPVDNLTLPSLFNDLNVGVEEKIFDGAYIRSTIPFVVRVKLAFAEQPIRGSNEVLVEIWDARDNVCSQQFNDDAIRKSRFIKLPSEIFEVQIGTEEEVDATGKPTGKFNEISFVDIPILPPQFAQGAVLFIQASFAGFISTQSIFILFENILQLDLNARAPISDGIDVAEQQAVVYFVDPDDPLNEDKRRSPGAGTVVRWELTPAEFGEDRPFFSTDEVSQTNGVFSFVKDGVARNVFFGPAADVEWHFVADESGGIIDIIGERYRVSAHVLTEGLARNDERLIEVFPLSVHNQFGSRILMEFSSFKNTFFADGTDYVKLVISKDPGTSETKYASCFRSCSTKFNETITVLDVGQIIAITTGDEIEILFGDVKEVIDVDPYLGEVSRTLKIGEDSFSTKGVALVPMKDSATTEVFFRINKFMAKQDITKDINRALGQEFAEFLNPCDCLGIKAESIQPNEFVVEGATTIISSSKPFRLIGGGPLELGVPPTIIIPKEPLEIAIVDQRVDGKASDTFVLDGVSKNEIVLEVSFSNKKVPDGTPITVTTAIAEAGGVSKLKFDKTIFTHTFIDEEIDAQQARSYATLEIDPVSPEEPFSEQIIFITNFDESGTVERESSVCANIVWNPADVKVTNLPKIFSGRLVRYDTSADTWTELATMDHARGHAHMEFVNSKLYAIGGIDNATISQFNEEYDIANDSWSLKTNLPTARFAGMSVVGSDKIYVFGGITVDDDSGDIIVSRESEVYTPSSDSWKSLADMPIVDDGSVDGRLYGVAFGIAKHIDNEIHILCGVTEMDKDGSIVRSNDRVLTYDISGNTWTASGAFAGVDLEIYNRISPSGFTTGNKVIVFGGASELLPAKDTDPRELIYATDSFSYDVSNSKFELNDDDFDTIPVPRYKSTFVSDGSNHYAIGGSNEVSQNVKMFERINSSTDPFTYARLTNIPFGVAGTASAVGTISASPYSNIQNIFVIGGFVSGREEGFLVIDVESSLSRVRLDGKQSVSVKMKIKDESGEAPSEEVKVLVRGFVKFIDTGSTTSLEDFKKTAASQQTDASQQQGAELVDERLAIYPVLFSSTEVTTSGGEAVVTLFARSDDILENIQDIITRANELAKDTTDESEALTEEKAPLTINAGEVRQPYHIIVQLTIDDDFFYGQTIEDLTLAFEDEAVDEVESTTGTGVTGVQSDLCQTSEDIQVSVAWTSFSRGISLATAAILKNAVSASGEGGATVFSLIPTALDQAASPLLPYFSDIDWIPSVTTRLGDNDGTADESLTVLENLENSIPFGASALFDALFVAGGIMSDNTIDDTKKAIYLFTDNESNLSVKTIDEAIDEINGIDGPKEVPVVTGLVSVIDPITLSAKANVSDINGLNRINREVGGQTLTVLSSDVIDEVVGLLFGEVTGSLGFGFVEFIFDLGSVSNIDKISALFNLFDNTSGDWTISVSEDSFNFTVIEDIFDANASVNFSDVKARYIKFTLTLTTKFAAADDPVSELTPLASVPSITQIEIVAEKKSITSLFFNTETAKTVPQQVALAINATKVDPEQIKIGVAKSDSHNWSDFFNASQPLKDQNGKVFIPIRRTENVSEHPRENLIKVDAFTFRAKYGRWDPDSTVVVYDKDNKIIDAGDYKAFSRDGIIIFNGTKRESLSIEIINGADFRVGVQVSNPSSTDPIEIFGLGFFYNTNIDLLPAVTRVPPEAKNVAIDPLEILPFTKITATYDFFDANLDEENKDLTEIRWFVNGVRVAFLDNIVTWNDLTDPNDPIYSQAITFDPTNVNNLSVVGTSGVEEEDAVSGDLDVESVETQARRFRESILKAGDSVYFTVRVSDGQFLSEIVKAPTLIVEEGAPIVENAVIKAIKNDGAISNVIRGNRTIVVQFDLLADTDVNNSQISWFVNNDLFKSGSLGTDESADRLIPGEINDENIIAPRINNEIFATIIPQTDGAAGDSITTDSVVVANSLPVIQDVILGPRAPRTSQNLTLSFSFTDYDIDVTEDQSQTNQSTIKWFKAIPGGSFVEITELAGESIVPSSTTALSERWKAEVTGFDGLDASESAVESNIVTIR